MKKRKGCPSYPRGPRAWYHPARCHGVPPWPSLHPLSPPCHYLGPPATRPTHSTPLHPCVAQIGATTRPHDQVASLTHPSACVRRNPPPLPGGAHASACFSNRRPPAPTLRSEEAEAAPHFYSNRTGTPPSLPLSRPCTNAEPLEHRRSLRVATTVSLPLPLSFLPLITFVMLAVRPWLVRQAGPMPSLFPLLPGSCSWLADMAARPAPCGYSAHGPVVTAHRAPPPSRARCPCARAWHDHGGPPSEPWPELSGSPALACLGMAV
jgi:hypothetical protein